MTDISYFCTKIKRLRTNQLKIWKTKNSVLQHFVFKLDGHQPKENLVCFQFIKAPLSNMIQASKWLVCSTWKTVDISTLVFKIRPTML